MLDSAQKDMLSTIANVCAILTFLGALLAWLNYKLERWSKTSKLKAYLKRVRQEDLKLNKSGQRTALHLIRHVGLTEDEILRASFDSKKIHRAVSVDPETSKANQLLFYFEK